MLRFIVLDGHKIYLRGMLASKYRTLEALEQAKNKEAARWESSNPRLAERIRTMPMLKWLDAGGGIWRREKL